MRLRIFILVLCIAASCRILGQQPCDHRPRFDAVEVDRFDVREGTNCPADFVVMVQEAIVKRLGSVGSVKEVLHPGEKPLRADAKVLRLTGVITYFNPGNQAVRFAIGFGAGEAEIDLHLSFEDAATHAILMGGEVRGLVMGSSIFMGGDSAGVADDVARRAVSAAELLIQTGAPEGSSEVASISPSQATQTNRREIPLVAVDTHKVEKTLNDLAASGYEIKGVNLAGGRNVIAIMEKQPDGAPVKQYRLILADGRGDIEDRLNQASNKGFRFTRNTLMPEASGGLDFFMEKTQAPSTYHFPYKVWGGKHATDICQEAGDELSHGFGLVGVAEVKDGNIVVLEGNP